jgi:hypothetical protein
MTNDETTKLFSLMSAIYCCLMQSVNFFSYNTEFRRDDVYFVHAEANTPGNTASLTKQ